MKLNLIRHNCIELEITGTIDVAPASMKDLREITRASDQLEDEAGVFFHQDYRRSKSKHHFHIFLEQLAEEATQSTIEINYSVVDTEEIKRTKYNAEYFISRIVEKGVKTFECKCEFRIPKEIVADALSRLPFEVSLPDNKLVVKGIYGTIEEGGQRRYDLFFRLLEEQISGPVFLFTFEFLHTDTLSSNLTRNVLDKALKFMNEYAKV